MQIRNKQKKLLRRMKDKNKNDRKQIKKELKKEKGIKI